mmetsp:Transcript_54081/g.143987  ORF Transcript_54081/g.143987 Transcript_54081/m.143987 type:complete len:222 (-) Transcript_54081:354-1019(-)
MRTFAICARADCLTPRSFFLPGCSRALLDARRWSKTGCYAGTGLIIVGGGWCLALLGVEAKWRLRTCRGICTTTVSCGASRAISDVGCVSRRETSSATGGMSAPCGWCGACATRRCAFNRWMSTTLRIAQEQQCSARGVGSPGRDVRFVTTIGTTAQSGLAWSSACSTPCGPTTLSTSTSSSARMQIPTSSWSRCRQACCMWRQVRMTWILYGLSARPAPT